MRLTTTEFSVVGLCFHCDARWIAAAACRNYFRCDACWIAAAACPNYFRCFSFPDFAVRAVVAIAAVSAPRIVDALAEPASVQLTVLVLVRGSDATVRRDRQCFFELWWLHSRASGARAPGDMPSFFEIGQLRSRG